MLSIDTGKVSVGINPNVGWEDEWDPAHAQWGSQVSLSAAMDTEPGHGNTLLWDLHLPCCPRSSCAASTPSSSWWSSSSTIPAQQGSPGTCTWAEAASTTHKGTADNPTLSCLSVELLPSHSRHKIPLRAERRTGALCQGSVFLMGAAPQPQHLHQALTHTRLFI